MASSSARCDISSNHRWTAESSAKRQRRGSVCAELPLVLLVLFVMIGFPLFDLATIGLRFAFVRYACESGAREAACASSFVSDNLSALSATHSAQHTVEKICSHFQGIHLKETTITVVGLPMLPGAPKIESSQPLELPDIKKYLYQYRVKVTAEIEPLITYNGNLFGQVPGLTMPLAMECHMERVCEKPEGLIK